MEIRVSVEGYGPMSSFSVARRSLRLVALAALAVALTACGGGGGGGDDGGGDPPPPPPTGEVAATVLEDQFSTPISGATVTVTNGTTQRTATTDADGKATVTDVPTGSVTVTATAPGFNDSPAQGATVDESTPAPVTFRLDRIAAEAAGGVLTVLPVGSLDPTGRSYTFSMRVVVVDENFEHVAGLGDGNFSLVDCPVVPPTGPLPDCVRGGNLDHDRSYTVSDTPPGVTEVQPAGPARPYAAALLVDQSGSIRTNDDTDARVFSTKVFLDGLGNSDSALLAAFAAEGTEGGTAAQIPTIPVTYYPCAAAPCLTPQFVPNGDDLFASVDSLADSEGGATPMYEALRALINATADNAPTGIPDQRLAVVMFSDGMSSECGFAGCVDERQAPLSANPPGVIALAADRGVDIFTVGLSQDVDSISLAEIAISSRGAYFFAENTTQLIPIYGTLGRLLSDSLPTYEMQWTVTAGEDGVFIGGTPDGRAVIGKLTVTTGTNTFVLPFVAPVFELP